MSVQNIPSHTPGQGVAAQAARTKAINPLPFAAIPHELLRDKRLSPTSMVIAGILLVYAKDKTTCWPSVATIARELDLSRRTVQLNIRQLEAAGWIRVRPANHPTHQEYVLLWRVPPEPLPKPAQKPYSQGLPGAQKTAPKRGAQFRAVNPAQSAAPELHKQSEAKKEGLAPASSEGGKPKTEEPDRVMTPEETYNYFKMHKMLDYHPGHALRNMAERKIEQARLLFAAKALVESPPSAT